MASPLRGLRSLGWAGQAGLGCHGRCVTNARDLWNYRPIPVRRLLVTLPVLPVLLLAACGDDSAEPLDTPPPATEAPSTTAPPTSASGGGTFEYATGADDVVIGVSFEGGLVPSVVVRRRRPSPSSPATGGC